MARQKGKKKKAVRVDGGHPNDGNEKETQLQRKQRELAQAIQSGNSKKAKNLRRVIGKLGGRQKKKSTRN